VNSLFDNESDLHDLNEDDRDREISLGGATIIGIFFALALLCAVFFGFGYTLGRRSSQPAAAPVATADTSLSTTPGGSKPAPGSPAASASTATQATDTPDSSADSSSESTARQTPSPAKPTAATAEPLTATPTLKPAAIHTTTPAAQITTPSPAAATPGTALVQVAAVSHQEDADTLVTALQRRGYSVAIHHEPQDKLLHVQIGPFATKKEAEAMRQRLLSDGYNAIVK
jgi:cell division septation protein DedD